MDEFYAKCLALGFNNVTLGYRLHHAYYVVNRLVNGRVIDVNQFFYEFEQPVKYYDNFCIQFDLWDGLKDQFNIWDDLKRQASLQACAFHLARAKQFNTDLIEQIKDACRLFPVNAANQPGLSALLDTVDKASCEFEQLKLKITPVNAEAILKHFKFIVYADELPYMNTDATRFKQIISWLSSVTDDKTVVAFYDELDLIHENQHRAYSIAEDIHNHYSASYQQKFTFVFCQPVDIKPVDIKPVDIKPPEIITSIVSRLGGTITTGPITLTIVTAAADKQPCKKHREKKHRIALCFADKTLLHAVYKILIHINFTQLTYGMTHNTEFVFTDHDDLTRNANIPTLLMRDIIDLEEKTLQFIQQYKVDP